MRWGIPPSHASWKLWVMHKGWIPCAWLLPMRINCQSQGEVSLLHMTLGPLMPGSFPWGRAARCSWALCFTWKIQATCCTQQLPVREDCQAWGEAYFLLVHLAAEAYFWGPHPRILPSWPLWVSSSPICMNWPWLPVKEKNSKGVCVKEMIPQVLGGGGGKAHACPYLIMREGTFCSS